MFNDDKLLIGVVRSHSDLFGFVFCIWFVCCFIFIFHCYGHDAVVSPYQRTNNVKNLNADAVECSAFNVLSLIKMLKCCWCHWTKTPWNHLKIAESPAKPFVGIFSPALSAISVWEIVHNFLKNCVPESNYIVMTANWKIVLVNKPTTEKQPKSERERKKNTNKKQFEINEMKLKIERH